METYEIKEKIIILNMAYQKIRQAIKDIENIYIANGEIGYFLWKFKKTHDQLNTKVLELLEKEQADKAWSEILTQLKKEG